MGLDMFLYKDKSIHHNQWSDDTTKVEVKVSRNGIEDRPMAFINQPVRVRVQIAYWRKFNALHKWFIDTCNSGRDDGNDVWVAPDDLQQLYKIIKKLKDELVLVDGKVANGYSLNDKGEKVYDYEDGKIIANPELAKSLLPTEDGFFFGSTDYDEYYYYDIEYTEKILKETVEAPDFNEWRYYYKASW